MARGNLPLRHFSPPKPLVDFFGASQRFSDLSFGYYKAVPLQNRELFFSMGSVDYFFATSTLSALHPLPVEVTLRGQVISHVTAGLGGTSECREQLWHKGTQIFKGIAWGNKKDDSKLRQR